MNSVEKIGLKLESWKNYCPEKQNYDNSMSKTSRELDDFLEESGNVDTELLKEFLQNWEFGTTGCCDLYLHLSSTPIYQH